MKELTVFGTIVLVTAGGLSVALLAARLPVPGPGIFLVAATLAAWIWPGLGVLSVRSVERIGVVALIVILFDGGMKIGLTRFRRAAVPSLSLGLAATFATAALLAGAAHWLLGFSWTASGLLGAALAPTDPAVMFSVLRGREIEGRAGTILEAESGVNDPVGISLMIGLLELARDHDASFLVVVHEFALQMAIGAAIGIAAGLVLVRGLHFVSLPSDHLYPLRSLAAAGVIYGVAAVAHGSGFLAVFVAGIILGDADVPHKRAIVRFQTSLASLAEIAVFSALGLIVQLSDLGSGLLWRDAAVLAVLLAFVARPLVVAPLLVPVRLTWGERLFVMWGGLKGAVPILLATLVVLDEIEGSARIFDVVYLVVAFSVLVQGTSIRWAERAVSSRGAQETAGSA